jgi:elongation factor 3
VRNGFQAFAFKCNLYRYNEDILLMDEPTNHLDVMNVKWVEEYLLGLKNVTCVIVSHDTGLLDRICGNIIAIDSLKLKQFRGNLTQYVAKNPKAKSYFELKSSTGFVMRFPQPGFIEVGLYKLNAVALSSSSGE